MTICRLCGSPEASHAAHENACPGRSDRMPRTMQKFHDGQLKDIRTNMNARHSSESVEHYTPAYIVEASRAALGGTISLDPASCEAANRTIKAKTYYNKEDNGLGRIWDGTVFLNPPGGKLGGKSQQKVWWEYLEGMFQDGAVTEAIFLSFSIELLQTSQVKPTGGTPHDYDICFPSRRIAYTREDGTKGGSPPHSSMVVYLGPNTDLFKAAFKDIGAFMGPL